MRLSSSDGARAWRLGRGLRRRIFVWFLGGLLTTAALVAALIFLFWRMNVPELPRALALVVVLLAAWRVSGRVAFRLALPLTSLASVVERIGRGELSARATLDRRAPDELGVVASAVNDMAGRIEQQLTDQRELLATVSHELRTPLARLRVLSELVREGDASPDRLDELDREIAELDALVGGLLANSRLDLAASSRRRLSLRDVGRRALERAGLPADLLAVEGDVDAFEADPTLLQRALANLLDNGTRHGGGVDGLAVSFSATHVRFEVLDRGPGVGPHGDSLFERFNRGADGQGAAGLGLGLSLVRRIARAHGGEAWAAGREGGGSRFGLSVERNSTPGQGKSVRSVG